ncbi:MAG: TRAP transporter small permease [Pseudomonadota bacterium]
MRTFAAVIDRLEESVIALIFAAMTLLTFVQVVLRYVFNSGFVWALEATTYLFAWLVLFGIAYGLKHGIHLGVDSFQRVFHPRLRRRLALVTVAAGLAYATLMFIGSWDYEARMYKIGIEAEDIPVERWILRLILPIGLALLALRLVQAGIRIWRGEQESLLLADEARIALRQHQEEANQR